MTTTIGSAYDLATLQRARGDSPLEVRQGLATTYHWVARAEPHLDLALAADGRPARTMTAVLNGLGPGQRAALRALLEDAASHLDRSPGLGAVPLANCPRHSTAATLGLRGERNGVALRVARAHAALICQGDMLLAARRRPCVYVLVARGGTVLAAIRAAPAPGTAPAQLRRHLPVIPTGP
jgi:hypothetical protein